MYRAALIFVYVVTQLTFSAPIFGGWDALPLDQQIVHVGNAAEPREIDPGKMTGVPESHIAENLFEGLTTFDPVDLHPVPGVAESWDVSKDGLTFTFKIRKDAMWSDGKKITADDFVWSWRRALSPALASEYAYQLYPIKNAEAYNTGKIKDPSLVGMKAKDAATLVVTLDRPTAYFLQLTAFHTLYPVPRHVVEKYPDGAWTKPEHLVSNGAFILVEWKINQYIKLLPNPKYRDRAAIRIKEAYLYAYDNPDTEERSFFSGKLHKTYEVPVLKIPLYEKQIKAEPKAYHPYRVFPYLGTYYYRINVTKKPLDNPDVRRALSLTLDRSLITGKISRSGEMPAQAFTPPGILGYVPPKMMNVTASPDDIKLAKELLAKAGYPEGKGFPKVEILYNTLDKHKKIAEAAQQMWKKHLGIEIGLYNKEWKVYLDTEKKMDYQISRAAWIGDYADPNTFLDMFVTNGGNNKTGWSNKEYDRMIAEAGSTIDQEKRFAAFRRAEEILMTELPIIPVYIYTNPTLIAQNLKMLDAKGEIVDYNANLRNLLFLKTFVLVK